MEIADKNLFKGIKRSKKTDENMPEFETVGVYEMSRMIAKKTKFRRVDVAEVLEELHYLIPMVLAEKKDVDLGGVSIVNRFVPYEKPKYIRTDDEDFWTFGYVYPYVEMGSQFAGMYRGYEHGTYKEEFTDNLRPYSSFEINDGDSLKKTLFKKTSDIVKQGRELVLDEDGYLRKDKKKKKYPFNFDFHPTWEDMMAYRRVKYGLMRDYKGRVAAGEDLGMEQSTYVYNGLVAGGFLHPKESADGGVDNIESY